MQFVGRKFGVSMTTICLLQLGLFYIDRSFETRLHKNNADAVLSFQVSRPLFAGLYSTWTQKAEEANASSAF